MPVKNFSPELLKVFEAGSKKAFEFDCQTEKDAFRLRWRLNALRREMRKERHWLTPVAEGVIISVKGSKLIARPPDTDIAEALLDALHEQAPEVMELPNLSKLVSQPTPIEDYLKGKKT